MRTAQIHTHLAAAREALAGGDFAVALEASQRALLLNGDDREALECEHRARTGLEERQITEWLAGARQELDRGALTSASLLVDRALSLNSSSPEAVAVRAKIDEARRLSEEEHARALAAAGPRAAACRRRSDARSPASTSATIDPRNSGCCDSRGYRRRRRASAEGAERARR